MAETVSAVVEQAPPDCGICSRSLLVGESLRLFREARSERLVKVCELCHGRAIDRGMERADAVERPRLRVQPSGSIADVAEREVVARGRVDAQEEPPAEVERAWLRRRLGRARTTIDDRAMPDEAVRAIVDRLRRQEDELDRLRQEHDPGRASRAQVAQEARLAEIRALRETVRQRDAQIERLHQARRAEASSMQMSAYALEAFNRSDAVERMARIARTLDAPVVNVHDEGMGLPRRIRVTLSWDIAWYEFMVKLDLGAGKASVHEVGSGGDAASLPRERRLANAQWRASGLVLV